MRRFPAAVAGALLGLAIALVHWAGFIIAGIAIGLVAATLRGAVIGSAAIGLVASTTFLGYAWYHGQLEAVLALGELTAIAVAVPVGLAIVGGLVRGVT